MRPRNAYDNVESQMSNQDTAHIPFLICVCFYHTKSHSTLPKCLQQLLHQPAKWRPSDAPLLLSALASPACHPQSRSPPCSSFINGSKWTRFYLTWDKGTCNYLDQFLWNDSKFPVVSRLNVMIGTQWMDWLFQAWLRSVCLFREAPCLFQRSISILCEAPL